MVNGAVAEAVVDGASDDGWVTSDDGVATDGEVATGDWVASADGGADEAVEVAWAAGGSGASDVVDS